MNQLHCLLILLVSCLASHAATSPRAHYANGQVWIVWDVATNNIPDTYAIYSAPGPFTNTAQATLIGRPFPGECVAFKLRTEVQAAYGAPRLTGFKIPLPGAGNYTLAGTEGLFVTTVRASGSLYFSVVPFGQTNVTAADRTTNAVSFTFSLNEPPRPVLQIRTNSTSGHPVSFFALWVDGDQNDTAARPDFPIMANAAKRGAAHTFMVVEPQAGLPGSGPWPATVCLHGGNGGAIEWLPSNDGPRSINIFPTDGVLIAFDDDLYRVITPGSPGGPVTTGHLGYAREYDPFVPSTLLPGSTIVNYTQRRNIWILDWLVANANVDAHRVTVLGHSNGAQGAMMLARVFPEHFSNVELFNCTMRLYDDPAFSSIYGTAADNFGTTVTNRFGQQVHMVDLTKFAAGISPVRDLPFFRHYAGKCDNNNDRQWGTVMLDQMRWSDQHGIGLHFYWDLKSHGFETWTDYWVNATTNSTLLLQMQRDDVRNQSRYRNDQSYPAFCNLQLYPNHGDPGPGYLGGSTTNAQCGRARDTNGLPVFNGDDHGTWGGYFDWQSTNIVDTSTNWACTMFLVSSNTGYAAVEACPFANLTADVALRRPQQFKPATGSLVNWQLQDATSGAVLQNGTNTVGADGLVTVMGLAIPRDPLRARLVISQASSAPPVAVGARLAIVTNGTDGLDIRWTGDTNYSSQLERSQDFLEWFQLDLPAQEANAVMSLAIPRYLLNDTQQFFRLARRLLVTSPIPTTPGYYTNQTFVHGGIARRYFLKVPAGWNAAQTWPLVFVLPGHGQSIDEFAFNQTELRNLADTDGWILVFAEATSGIDSYRWFPYDNPNDGQPYVDDAAFLFALVTSLEASGLNVNTNRIYVSGFSNGGSMTHYLAGKPNHPFAAFAIMESGTATFTFYHEPYDRDAPDSGTPLLANVPVPWQPRPALLMNMATSVPWTFEGRQLSTNLFSRGARHNVARWTQANGYGSVSQPAPVPALPPPALVAVTNAFNATGTDRCRVAYEDVRPDQFWPTNLIAAGWSQADALRFPYLDMVGTNVIDNRLPEWVRVTYPHTLSPDPASPTAFVRVDSGTITTEIWRSSLNNRSNEVIFVGLSDGGHQWPNAADHLPFDASVEVLKFFAAH